MQARTLTLTFALALASTACRATSSSHAVVPTDPTVRAPLLDAVASLAGHWKGTAPDGSSGGSAVREIMLPATPSEMTNMYTLDGNGLVMTHYCAAGNQPHMRATAIGGDRIVFESVGVSDLKSEDEVYMGAMTLVIRDADHIEQHWYSYRAGVRDESHDMVFEMERIH